jgi:deoxyribodipyrimidine photo-lyase
VVVTDEYPVALPSVKTVDEQAPVRVEKIDGNGLLPLRAADQAFPTAYAFRRFLQRTLREHLLDAPRADPFARVTLPRLKALSASIRRRWPAASPRLLAGEPAALAGLPIDHGVPPATTVGGPATAHARWKAFLTGQLAGYPELRNQPECDATSGLAPYLHFGHISAHEVFYGLARQQEWSPGKLAEKGTGSREGWWGMSAAAEAFLDQLVTWREVGFNFCGHRSEYDDYDSLPAWAKATLAKHAKDNRPYVYTMEQFAAAETHDRLWNAAQRQLVTEGHIHNYLRMLWGKKILEWTNSPLESLDIMVELNNRYALDGQDPNSYSGIFWTLGRYDRPWGPERPIFGTVRYMSSENTARKVRVREYIRRYSAGR